MSRVSLPLIITLVVFLGAVLLPMGCGRSGEALTPAHLALLPGSVGPGEDDLVVVADDQYLLRWKQQWIPTAAPTRADHFLTGSEGFGTWSPSGDKFACPYRRDIGTSDLYIYFFDRGIYQGWEGRYSHMPLHAQALALRFAGSKLQVIGALYQGGIPDRMLRVAYDRIALLENVKPGTTTGTVKVTTALLPENWPLRTDSVQAAFLGEEGRWVAVAGAGEVLRWDLSNPDRLEPCLTLAQVTAQEITPEQARAARLSLLTGPQDTPVYAACWLPERLLVWRLSAQGPAEFVGDAQTVGSQPVLQLAACPDGKQWAVLTRGDVAPSTAGEPLGSPAILYLTGPRFDAPRAVELAGHDPRDPAWSPTGGNLYFVVDGTELWKLPPGSPPAQLALAPPRASLRQTPGK